jgi:hypothetical protein
MQTEQLQQGISAKFEQSRLVFWYDPEQSFKEAIETGVKHHNPKTGFKTEA